MSNLNFVLNGNTTQEGESFDLSDDTLKEALFLSLKDNTEGFIGPKPIRDALISIWSNNAFKETSIDDKPSPNIFFGLNFINNNNNKYIGIDTLNPIEEERDLKYKIFFGKRIFNGDEILDNNSFFTPSESDIYFFNTKDDLEDQITTKLSFLAGSDSNLYIDAPYISSQYVSDVVPNLSMNIVNKNEINISGNDVSINDIKLPNTNESNLQDIDNKILIYDNNINKLKWDNFTITLSDLGTPSEELNILGDVNVNGFDLDFTDDRYLPVDFGGLIQGETFNSDSITEILKRVIYPEQAPKGFIEILPPFDNGFVEIGTFPNPVIKYRIEKKTNPINTTLLFNMNPSFYEPIGGTSYQTIIGLADGIVISPISNTEQTFKIEVSDGINTSVDEKIIKGVYPYFYGIGNIPTLNNSNLSFLTKLVENKGIKEINILGNGKVYFLYPIEYGTLDNITDEGDNILSFNVQIINYSSPEGHWASKDYYLYSSTQVFNLNTPKLFKFKMI